MKEDLIFMLAAVLMAVSAQGVSADELPNEAATIEGNQFQAAMVGSTCRKQLAHQQD